MDDGRLVRDLVEQRIPRVSVQTRNRDRLRVHIQSQPDSLLQRPAPPFAALAPLLLQESRLTRVSTQVAGRFIFVFPSVPGPLG
jgi:hypothetical protein